MRNPIARGSRRRGPRSAGATSRPRPTSLNQAIVLNPRASSYYYVIAGVFRRLGLTEESRKALEMFKRLEKEAASSTRSAAAFRATQRTRSSRRGFPTTACVARREFITQVGSAAFLQSAPGRDADNSAVTFTDVTAAAGLLRARNVSGSPGDKQFLLEEMGCGAAFFDYDHDGWLDIFLVNGSSLDPRSATAALPAICFTTIGTARFTDVTKKAGLTHSGWGQGCCVGDYDNDGFDDLFVSYFGRNVLYHNNGDGTFTDVTQKAGVAGSGTIWGAGCCFLDYDRDGHLDLFVASYVNFDPAKAPRPGDWSTAGTTMFRSHAVRSDTRRHERSLPKPRRWDIRRRLGGRWDCQSARAFVHDLRECELASCRLVRNGRGSG